MEFNPTKNRNYSPDSTGGDRGENNKNEEKREIEYLMSLYEGAYENCGKVIAFKRKDWRSKESVPMRVPKTEADFKEVIEKQKSNPLFLINAGTNTIATPHEILQDPYFYDLDIKAGEWLFLDDDEQRYQVADKKMIEDEHLRY